MVIPKKDSVYATNLYRQMDLLLARQGGAFTLAQLSKFTGLPITQNMRRRINHCVAAGTLYVHPTIAGMHGNCNLYVTPELHREIIGELPF